MRAVVFFAHICLGSALFAVDPPPAELAIRHALVEDAFNRVGQTVRIRLHVRNAGWQPALNLKVSVSGLPQGVRSADPDALAHAGELEGTAEGLLFVDLVGTVPAEFKAVCEVSADGVRAVRAEVPVRIRPSLGLARTSYVPVPQPVKTDYDIGALYFPGWYCRENWERVAKTCPERKPVLGWYDESNPEVVDWQIKWLVESGIRTLYVDWYWHKTATYLDHWLKAFSKSRYRSLMKWAMMWANHEPNAASTEEDQRNLTRYWIDHYFKTPEYRYIDGMPVVWVWQAENVGREAGPDGCRRMLDLSRQMARDAGLKGIYFIVMKWPDDDCSPELVSKYRDQGFDMTGLYHFMGHGGKAKEKHRWSYDCVADANPLHWRDLRATGVLPFLPNLSTGWDDRPWNNSCEVYGKSAKTFLRICREAKKFADETGVKRLTLAPLNEWGEGSYAEPNAEHGFGFYKAVRETFCEEPKGGWPSYGVPRDYGLGPYDFPMPPPPKRLTGWDFSDGGKHGWKALWGVEDFQGTPEGLSCRITGRQHALYAGFLPVLAEDVTEIVYHVRTTSGTVSGLRVYWQAPGAQFAEHAALSAEPDGTGDEWTFRFPVAKSAAWTGLIGAVRTDIRAQPDSVVTIRDVRLVRKGK